MTPMHARSFLKELSAVSWNDVAAAVETRSSPDVEHALTRIGRRSIADFMALISPAALPYLPQMKQQSAALTRQRFGNTVQMYVPLYLSNECSNICTYCGFSLSNKLERITLSTSQILKEVEVIKQMGFDHVLIVTGESPRNVGMDYFKTAIKLIRPHFSSITFEVQPLEEKEYRELIDLGLHSVLVYQETYNHNRYKEHHPKGKKSNFAYRLETPERLGQAGIHKIGLGILIGLDDWRVDATFLALHLMYLRRIYWKTRFSISFPRLRPAEGVVKPYVEIAEDQLAQLICAFRLIDENIELSLSTRERASFRDQAVDFGITTLSAGSRTEPGGYTSPKGALRQFEIDDNRAPQEVEQAISARGYDIVWKDWDRAFGI